MQNSTDKIAQELQLIRELLEKSLPKAKQAWDYSQADAFVFQANTGEYHAIKNMPIVPLEYLQCVDYQKELLLNNSLNLAQGLPCNNVLLWGARGTGKSSLVKAVQNFINQDSPILRAVQATRRNIAYQKIKMIEIPREDLGHLPKILLELRAYNFPIILFCDDLSFEHDDIHYKSLKAVLDGGIAGRPANIVLYATSNRRHLMPRNMIENEQSSAINPSEANEEKISLSDRFGLSIGFYHINQDDFFAMISGYVQYYKIPIDEAQWQAKAVEWSRTRGSQSGRTAYQFICDLCAQYGIKMVN